jgi:hypothetical protein
MAMVKLFDAAVAMPAVADAAVGDAGHLTEALARFKPLCCFVGKHAMDRIYAETLPGPALGVADAEAHLNAMKASRCHAADECVLDEECPQVSECRAAEEG